MRARKVWLCTFSVPEPYYSSLCLFMAVSRTGHIRFEGMLRMPYSDRPKRGGGKGVPQAFLNVSPVSLDVGSSDTLLRCNVVNEDAAMVTETTS